MPIGEDYGCPKCNRNWFIIKGYYELKPKGRAKGQCYCGTPFPKSGG